MPVRRSRSRLRPFLRVTRHSKARGAPSWRAIPRTSAELMASTTAETLRWVPILCPYSGFDRDFDRCCVPPGHAAVRLELSSCLFLAAPSCPAFLRPPTRRLVDTGDHSAHKAHGFDRFLSSRSPGVGLLCTRHHHDGNCRSGMSFQLLDPDAKLPRLGSLCPLPFPIEPN